MESGWRPALYWVLKIALKVFFLREFAKNQQSIYASIGNDGGEKDTQPMQKPSPKDAKSNKKWYSQANNRVFRAKAFDSCWKRTKCTIKIVNKDSSRCVKQ